jgi:GDP-L-fucose synthase
MDKSSKIYIAGQTGMVGGAIYRHLKSNGFKNLCFFSRSILDLTVQDSVARIFKAMRPEYIFLCAGKVGGIRANNENQGSFLYENLQIQNNVIHYAWKYGVKKLLNLGSSCIYPKLAPQPLKEEYLMSGPLEPTNEGYAIAKIAGIKMCQMYRRQYGCDFISVLPTNLIGPNDNYDSNTSHVLPALIRKFHEAKILQKKQIVLWGTGTPKREFLHVDDLARACVMLMRDYSDERPINIGSGQDQTIKELAELVKGIIGFSGEIVWNGELDGTPRKLLDISKIKAFGWEPKISLKDGIKRTYEDFLNEMEA